MKLTLDPEPIVKKKRCPNCQAKYTDIRDLVYRDGSAYAIALIECHQHDSEPEIFFTIIFGSWGDDSDYAKNQTIGCRCGRVIGQDGPACSLMDVSDDYTESIFGKKLSRSEALATPLVEEFWQVVDYLLENDVAIHAFLHHSKED